MSISVNSVSVDFGSVGKTYSDLYKLQTVKQPFYLRIVYHVNLTLSSNSVNDFQR